MTAVENVYEADIRKFEEQDRLRPPPKGAALFTGSSTIALWHSLAEDFAPVATIRRGYGGSSIADAVHFAQRIVIPYQPRKVLLYAGDNDLATGKTPQGLLQDFVEFAGRVRKGLPAATLYFISIKPSPSRRHLLEAMQAANGLIRDFTRRAPGLGFIDITGVMLDGRGEIRSDLFIEDGLHMNPKGYALWVPVIRPFLTAPARL